jgi:hypothetical protein
MTMGRTSVKNPANQGFNRLLREGFLARGIVRAELYARVSTHDQQTREVFERLGGLHRETAER